VSAKPNWHRTHCRAGRIATGDDARAKASVSGFIETLGLRPLDVGGLEMAHWLEGAGLLMMGLAGRGARFNIELGVDLLG
jgi:8-hydroxy-5-deazaflavin:NADPH oxidoreductase